MTHQKPARTLMAFLIGDEKMPPDWRMTADFPWLGLKLIGSHDYRCGYCSKNVASKDGWVTDANAASILICPHCNGPTFFSRYMKQWPGPREGEDVSELPEDVQSVYGEARDSLSVNAFTGSVMLCRKILMNIAVSKGATIGLQFAAYVEWLVNEGYAPKGSDGWLKYIKDRGNEANHEIVSMTREDAIGVLRFTEQLLRNMFELPSLVPPVPEEQS